MGLVASPALTHLRRGQGVGRLDVRSGWWRHWFVLLSLWLLCLAAGAQEVQPVPVLSARVIDATATLTPEQLASIDAKLAALESAKGTQLVLLMVPTTVPEDITAYANRVANSWKIGRSAVGDGVLLVVAKNDRKLRIEVAKTLEGAIPDLAAKHIIDQAISPRFKQGDFAGGLIAGVDQLVARISGETLPAVESADVSGIGAPDFQWFDLLIFAVFALPIATAIARSVFGRRLGALLTGVGVGGVALALTASLIVAALAGVAALVYALATAFTVPGKGRGRRSGGSATGGDWSGGGFSSSGGGGFSSGGGGDFGGGGASGDW